MCSACLPFTNQVPPAQQKIIKSFTILCSVVTLIWGVQIISEGPREVSQKTREKNHPLKLQFSDNFSSSLIKTITSKYSTNKHCMLGNCSTVIDRNSQASLCCFTPLPQNSKGWHQKHKMASALCFKNMPVNNPSESKYGAESLPELCKLFKAQTRHGVKLSSFRRYFSLNLSMCSLTKWRQRDSLQPISGKARLIPDSTAATENQRHFLHLWLGWGFWYLFLVLYAISASITLKLRPFESGTIFVVWQ